jgi:hypothetical protein
MRDHDPLDTRDQERSRQDAEQRNKLAMDTEVGDIKWLMGSKRGRRIVWRHLERAGVFRLSFNTNAMAMAFAEGNRNEGLHILSLVHAACPELYPVMLKEQNSERDSDDGRRTNQ